MSRLFELEIVTPMSVVFSGSAAAVFCPGTEGRFEVLYNHAPLLASLAVGELNVEDENGGRIAYAVSGGIAQVLHNKVMILADTAEAAEKIDVSRANAAKSRAEERLARREGIDTERARAALYRAVNRLKVAVTR
jgi:F-type H+-transporting ATPase subunit epsilon